MEHKIKRSQEQHQWKEKIEELLKNMKYGNITIIVQDGKIIQIDNIANRKSVSEKDWKAIISGL